MLQNDRKSLQNPSPVQIVGRVGRCGDREVFLSFAPAKVLHSHSFADVLDEDSGLGYQRKFNGRHSRDFRQYIQQPGSTTIPLTFNLRPGTRLWSVSQNEDGNGVLTMTGQAMAQVDCQHRIGSLADHDMDLAFMAYLGLTCEEEASIFTVINSKAKGLSTSLLDYNLARLSADLGSQAPHLYIALHLNSHDGSPWFRQLDLGGQQVLGMKRRASLRMMQVAVQKFLKNSNILATSSTVEAAQVVLDFWCAIAGVLAKEWRDSRRYFVVKGIGVYSLMLVAADLYIDAVSRGLHPDTSYFTAALREFIGAIDWSNHGPLEGFSGESGATKAYKLLRDERMKSLKTP